MLNRRIQTVYGTVRFDANRARCDTVFLIISCAPAFLNKYVRLKYKHKSSPRPPAFIKMRVDGGDLWRLQLDFIAMPGRLLLVAPVSTQQRRNMDVRCHSVVRVCINYNYNYAHCVTFYVESGKRFVLIVCKQQRNGDADADAAPRRAT